MAYDLYDLNESDRSEGPWPTVQPAMARYHELGYPTHITIRECKDEPAPDPEDFDPEDEFDPEDDTAAQGWGVDPSSVPARVVRTVGKVCFTVGDEDGVSEVARLRIERHQQVLNRMGLATPPPVFAAGTRVRSDGAQRFTEFRQAWEEMPTVAEAVHGFAACIAREDREQHTFNLGDLRMNDDGTVQVPGNGTVPFEPRALRKVLSVTRKGDHAPASDYSGVFHKAGPFLSDLEPDERAWIVNKRMALADRDQRVMLHTRHNADAVGGRSAYAVTGAGYALLPADQLLQGAIQGVDMRGAKARITYNPDTTYVKMDATWVPDNFTDLAAGDAFKAGMRLYTKDDGGGSIRGGGIVEVNRCRNLIILAKAYAESFRFAHKGDLSDMAARVADGFGEIVRGFAPMLEDWEFVESKPIADVELWGERFLSVPDALTWAVENGKLAQDLSDKVALEALLGGYAAEQAAGFTRGTLTDIVDAVTRAAWNTALDEMQQHLLEREAGLLVPVLVGAAQA